MQVFLIRHADSVPETVAVRDPARNLSATGRAQARALGERLRHCRPTQIWTSPLVRAVQTAELVASSMRCEVVIDSRPELAPDGSPRDAVAAVKALASDAVVVVVGHEPSLSAIAALLVGDPSFESLAKAEAVELHDNAVRRRVAWNAEL